MYLSKDSLNCDIVSAKSSEMNILVPHEEDEYVSVKYKRQMDTVVLSDSTSPFMCQNLPDVLVLPTLFLVVPQRELPVPEQFKTIWNGSKLVTEPTEIAG